jgi:hypothetical protein
MDGAFAGLVHTLSQQQNGRNGKIHGLDKIDFAT